jgi:hypothetical protein
MVTVGDLLDLIGRDSEDEGITIMNGFKRSLTARVDSPYLHAFENLVVENISMDKDLLKIWVKHDEC